MDVKESRIAFIGFCIGVGTGMTYAKTGKPEFAIRQITEAANWGLVCANMDYIQVKPEEVEYVAKLLEPLIARIQVRASP